MTRVAQAAQQARQLGVRAGEGARACSELGPSSASAGAVCDRRSSSSDGGRGAATSSHATPTSTASRAAPGCAASGFAAACALRERDDRGRRASRAAGRASSCRRRPTRCPAAAAGSRRPAWSASRATRPAVRLADALPERPDLQRIRGAVGHAAHAVLADAPIRDDAVSSRARRRSRGWRAPDARRRESPARRARRARPAPRMPRRWAAAAVPRLGRRAQPA